MKPLTKLISRFGNYVTDLTGNTPLKSFIDEEHYNRDKNYL